MDILVLDDEKEITELVELYLRNEGFQVRCFYTGEAALASVKQSPPDLAILDVMLPDMDGFSAVSYTHLDVYKRQIKAFC